MDLYERVTQWLSTTRAILLLVTFGLLAYFNTLFNGFVWDDEEQIVNNTIVHSLANIGQVFSGGTFNTGGAGLSGWFFRPLLTLNYMLLYVIFSDHAFGFHLFQFSFHIANAVLLYLILTRLLPLSDVKSRLVSFIISAIFVVHPAFVEAVSYIASLHYVMLMFFNLLALWLMFSAAKITYIRTVIVCLLLIVGLLYGELSITALPIFLVFVWLYKRQQVKYYLVGFTTSSVIYFYVRLLLVQTSIRHPEFAPISEAPLVARLMTVPMEILDYLRIFIFPDKLAISQHFVVSRPSLFGFLIPLLIVLSFFVSGLYLAWMKRSKLLFFGIIWFATGFALISNVFPLDMTIAERWFYFPAIGLLFVLAQLCWWILAKRRLLAPMIMCTCLIITVFAIRTIVRNSNWHNGLTLYSHDSKIVKNSFDLENNFGVELFRAGQTEQAKGHFERSIQLQPKWYFAYNNLGAVYDHEGKYPEAEELYRQTLQRSDYYLAYENLAQDLLFHDSTASAQVFTANAVKKLPYNGKLWFLLAIADYQLGKKDEAVIAAGNAYALYPNQDTSYVYSQLTQNKSLDLNLH